MNATTTDNPTTLTPPPIPQDAAGQKPHSVNTPSAQDSAAHNIVVGGLWCVGGILVTAVTYSAAQQNGGYYVIAWGAILFGGIQFLMGLCQLAK